MPTATVRGLDALRRDLARLGAAARGRLARNAAMADELVTFSRAALNGTQEVIRASLDLAAQTQEQQAITTSVEHALRPWQPPGA